MPPQYRYHGSRLVYLVSVTLFVAAATIAVLIATGFSLNVTTHTLTKSGLLVLNSTPKDAAIIINGQQRKEFTSARLKLQPGRYDVVVKKSGTIPWQKSVNIEPGNASLEEDILLFTEHPNPIPLAATDVIGQALSSDEHDLAFLVREGNEVALWHTGVSTKPSPRKLLSLPAPYASYTALAFRPGSNRILVSSAGETTIVTTAGEVLSRVPIGGDVRFASGLNDNLLFIQNQELRLLARSTGTQTILESSVTVWTVNDESVYAQLADQSVVRRDLREGNTSNRKVVGAPVPIVAFLSSASGNVLYAKGADRSLSVLTDNGFTEIADNVDQVAVELGGTLVAYTSDRELRVWKRSTKQNTLVTRFSDPPDQLAVFPDSTYIAYANDSNFHAIAFDGSNDQQLGPAGAVVLAGNFQVFTDPAKRSLSLIPLVQR